MSEKLKQKSNSLWIIYQNIRKYIIAKLIYSSANSNYPSNKRKTFSFKSKYWPQDINNKQEKTLVSSLREKNCWEIIQITLKCQITVCVSRGGNVSFSENFAYILNEWNHIRKVLVPNINLTLSRPTKVLQIAILDYV